MPRLPTIGVLALQGDVEEHLHALHRSGATAKPIKTAESLSTVDALIIPGGESTTVIRLLDRFALTAPIIARAKAGMPIWGTCMGMILTARSVAGLDQKTLNLLDITVRRNAFGRQQASEEIDLPIPTLGEPPFPAVFIRAPWIERAGPAVQILATHAGHGVFVRENDVIGTSFHPELTADDRLHHYFIKMVNNKTNPMA